MENNKNQIDVSKVLRKIFKKKIVFFISWPIVAVLSCLLIVQVPRYYTTTTRMAPEVEQNGLGGSITDIASSFGVDLGTAGSSDAISPLLYPDLMEDNSFVAMLFEVPVTVNDEERHFTTTYYDYLDKKQKKNPLMVPVEKMKKMFAPKNEAGHLKQFESNPDPYFFSKRKHEIAEIVRGKINISVDKQTAVITISVSDQDPLVCKNIADTLRLKLQDYITCYRTNKSTIDMHHYEQLMDEAKLKYDSIVREYSALMDSNQDVVLMSEKYKQDDLENEMQLRYNAYTTLTAQYEAARAKVQERTPAFTMIQGAAVPVKPAGPKRMLFVLGMLILASFVDVLVILRKDIKNYFLE